MLDKKIIFSFNNRPILHRSEITSGRLVLYFNVTAVVGKFTFTMWHWHMKQSDCSGTNIELHIRKVTKHLSSNQFNLTDNLINAVRWVYGCVLTSFLPRVEKLRQFFDVIFVAICVCV